jgi:Replication-relaxation
MTRRDQAIILTVGRFGQLASGHVRDLFFSNLSSDTPSKRRLHALTQQGYLCIVERRPIGGSGRGSGQAVYQLGSKGWDVCRREGKYWPFRSIDHHRLAIADAYVAIKRLEAEGRYEVGLLVTEPDTHQEIGGTKLTPDLHIELTDKALGHDHLWWLEIDMGTERQVQIKDKLARYWHAYEHIEADEMPLVVFLAPDAERARDLRRWIEQGPAEAQQLFTVHLQDEFPTRLLAMY